AGQGDAEAGEETDMKPAGKIGKNVEEGDRDESGEDRDRQPEPRPEALPELGHPGQRQTVAEPDRRQFGQARWTPRGVRATPRAIGLAPRAVEDRAAALGAGPRGRLAFAP